MLSNKLIDGIIDEPLGGAHTDLNAAASSLKKAIKDHLKELNALTAEERISQRIDKFGAMGVFQ